jgi:isoquinoline 1-oxidoreductase beta subunit
VGGKLKSVDAGNAQRVPGVLQVLEVPSGVAVVAEHTYAALEGRRALRLEWDRGPHQQLDDAAIEQALRSASEQEGAVGPERGDALGAIEKAQSVHEAEYTFPYLAHATMEPMNAVAHVHDGQCEIWAPTQNPDGAQELAANLLGISRERVVVHKTYLGGGFGRRTNLDEIAEAVQVSRQLEKPVQLVWTREDDMRHGRYREAARHRLRAAFAEDGSPLAIAHRIVTASPDEPQKGWFNDIAAAGAELPYAIPHSHAAWSSALLPIPVTIWRSVGHSHTTFAVETFIDELSHAKNQDPVSYRSKLLEANPRLKACLTRVAALCDYDESDTSRFLGVAVAHCFHSYVAQIVEVVEDEKSGFRVSDVWCAVDCGMVVNPDTVHAQLEGGIVFGLSAALYGELHVTNGVIREDNFDGYRLLRINETPRIHVEVVESAADCGGIGEVGVPTLAPALGNALFRASGKRHRSLPFPASS